MRTEGTKEASHAAAPAQPAWHEKAELLAVMSRLAQIGGWEFDPVTGQGCWTEEIARIHDLDTAHPAGVQFGLSFYPGASRIKIEQAVREAVELGKPYDLELEFISAKGVHKWVRTVGVPVKTGDRVVKVWGTLQDITARKRTEAELVRNRAEWENVLQAIGAPIAILDPQHGVLTANQALLKLTGKTFEELRTLKCWEFFHGPRQHGPHLNCPMEVMRESGHEESREVYCAPFDATYLVSCTPIFDNAGQLAKIIHCATDITELKRLQQDLLQAQKMETVGRLAGGIAHDFNNVLQTILGYTELLLKGTPAGDERQSDLQEIQRSGERAAALTRQLLAFSRRQMLMPTVADLNALIVNLAKMLTRLLGEDIKLKLDLAPDLGRVRVDPSQLDQVLMNLAVNARDAMPRGGQIVLRTEQLTLDAADLALHPEGRAGAFIRLSFSDTGSGMSKAVQGKIFEPFFTTKEQGKGTGMGLATVYGIIKQHDGWITVYSEPGQGTAFKIYLPAFAAPVTVPPLTPPPAVRPPLGHGEVILLAEDEPYVRRMTEQLLTKSGYQATAVGTCAEAREQCGAHVRLLFSDVVLPDGSGLDLVRELQQKHPHLRCVLASGYADIHERWPEIAEHGWPFLVKPYKKADLLHALATALNHTPA
jgi:PAS domain S-box-containing protein